MRRGNIWFILDNNHETDGVTHWKSLDLKFDSQIYTLQALNDSAISIEEVYRIADGWPVKVNPVGLWNRETGLIWTESNIWERRRNLEGHSFLCATEDVSV